MTDTTIKAIETSYKGHRFRSRLEARWAVFFESMGYRWRYEHQGYEINGRRYLPDFELTDADGDTFFVEVKGDANAMANDYERYVALFDFGGCLPEFLDCATTGKTGLILLSDIPIEGRGTWFHPLVQHHKGLHRNWCAFRQKGISSAGSGLVAHLCDIARDDCIEGSPENWKIENRLVDGRRELIGVSSAYRAARCARFEFGEVG